MDFKRRSILKLIGGLIAAPMFACQLALPDMCGEDPGNPLLHEGGAYAAVDLPVLDGWWDMAIGESWSWKPGSAISVHVEA